MAETVDKWSILLTLKSLGFKKGMGEVTDSIKTAKKSTTSFIDSLKGLALAGGAVVGLGAILKSFSSNTQALDVLATTTGESARELRAWKMAVDDMGVSGDSAVQALAGIDAAMGRIKTTGYDDILVPMQRLGIAAYNTNGQLKSSAQIASEFANKTRGMDKRMRLAFGAQFGFGPDMIYAMDRMGADLPAIINKKKLLTATTEEDIQRNREWMETVSQLKQLWQSLVNTIATTLIPVLRQVANVFGYIMQYKPVLEGLLIGIAVLIGVGIVNAIRAAAVAAAGFMATIAPILPILIGIGLLIKGISYIKDKLSPGMEKFNEPINPNDSRMYNNIKGTMPGSRTTSNSYGGAVSNNTSNTKIDTVTINTAATDSKGIAGAFYGDMKIIGATGGAF